MATEEQIDATCRRLQASRSEIFQLARVIRGEHQPPPEIAPPAYRSHIMRTLTGQPARTIGRAALAVALSRPRALWKLTTLLPLLRPVLTHYLSQGRGRPRKLASTA